MATRFAAREVLVLVTKEDNRENREGIDGAINRGKTRFCTYYKLINNYLLITEKCLLVIEKDVGMAKCLSKK